jgi:PH domain
MAESSSADDEGVNRCQSFGTPLHESASPPSPQRTNNDDSARSSCPKHRRNHAKQSVVEGQQHKKDYGHLDDSITPRSIASHSGTPTPQPLRCKVSSCAELSNESTIPASNYSSSKRKPPPASLSTSFDDSCSLVTYQHHNNNDATSNYETSGEGTSYYSDGENISNLTGHNRYHRKGGGGGGNNHNNNNNMMEMSTVSSASAATNSSMMFHSGNASLDDPSAAFNFMMEHRIFLNAALNLLNEKDSRAPELGMMDPIILKAGPLKKASQLMNGVWKVKYVEIRRGMFSYYENAAAAVPSQKQEELLHRKNIPLEASICICRAVKLHQKALNFSPGGAIFELSIHNSNNNNSNHNNHQQNNSNNHHHHNNSSSNSNNVRRLWMANSREERQAWIQAINNAMVGGSVTRGDATLTDHRGIVRTVSGRSPFKNDLRRYLKAQSVLRNAKATTEYLSAQRELLDQTLHVPIKWIAKQGALLNDHSAGNLNAPMQGAFHEENVELSIDQLWRDLQRDSVCINGLVFRGDMAHGPERILGFLTRRILRISDTGSRPDLRESKALVYARDILLAGNRTRSAGDAYYCVNTLCGNADLTVVVPSRAPVGPVEFDVSEDDSDESFHNRFNDKSGWIKTRTRNQRTWRKHFFVLSEGTLSSYQGATPRPHGLRFQRRLADATLSIERVPCDDDSQGNVSFIVTLALKDGSGKDGLLLFESEDKLLDWVYVLECFSIAGRPRSGGGGNSNNNAEPQAGSIAEVVESAELSTMEHAQRLNLDPQYTTRRLRRVAQRATSAVRVSVKASTQYIVCTTDPSGDEQLDNWATVQADFLQAFRITGGPNGRISRGEEIVRLKIVDCLDPTPPQQQHHQQQHDGGALSPTSMRARLNRRIFRNPSSSNDDGTAAVVLAPVPAVRVVGGVDPANETTV